MRIQSAVEHERHELDELVRAADRPEGEPPAEFGDRRTGSPFQAQPFDEQLCPDTSERFHPVVDRLPDVRVVTPVRGEEPAVLRGRRTHGDYCGQRGLQQPHGVAGVAVDIEDVHQPRMLVPRPRPPSGPGHHAIAAQGEPQPFRAAAAGRQVAAYLTIEDVRQAVEQVQLIRPGDRAQGQVMLVQDQGILLEGGALSAPGSAQLITREDTSAACMAYMAQPSFLIAPVTSC